MAIGPAELLVLLLLVAGVVIAVRMSGRRRPASRFDEIPTELDHINNPDVMAEFRRISSDPREAARHSMNWVMPLTTKADVLGWLLTIPSGATLEQIDHAGKELFRSRGLALPPGARR